MAKNVAEVVSQREKWMYGLATRRASRAILGHGGDGSQKATVPG